MKTKGKVSILLFSVSFLCTLLVSCEQKDSASPGLIQDIDGNTYTIIQIGNQIWMAENLKVTRSKDGKELPYISNSLEWSRLNTPGYCWYDHDEEIGEEFGALYNWYLVSTCEICPEGWHLPTDEEWTEFENYLEQNGYNYDGSIDSDTDRKTNNKIGKAVTSKDGWDYSENEGAIGNTDYSEYKNLSGFNVLPAGMRDANGGFQCLDEMANIWSTDEYNELSGIYRRFLNASVKVLRDEHSKKDGFSVRCIKDREQTN